MRKKVLLISIDGVRADAVKSCNNSYINELEKISAYTYNASSMIPSVTLPCHYSMTHSVTPNRHGILTNTFVPQVRPVLGIFERAYDCGLLCAMYYNWHELRDVVESGKIKLATYIHYSLMEDTDAYITEKCAQSLATEKPDFAFLYLGETDEVGHKKGWMSKEYLDKVSSSYNHVKRLINEFGNEYEIIVVTDHGGHDRTHGSEMVEDMVIPFFFVGKSFTAGEITNRQLSLLDIAPTIATLLGIELEREWEGTSLI